MRLEFLFLGKTRESYLDEGISDFLNRLNRFVATEIRIIKEKRWSKGTAAATIRAEEGKLLLRNASEHALLVALDRKGRQLSSEMLAEQLSRWEEQNRRCVTFIIGGHLGLDPLVLEKSNEVISLSQMTFTHEMSRLILLEQLYRAYSIKAGSRYHK